MTDEPKKPMPVYIYTARWFHVKRVKHLLWVMERNNSPKTIGWWWNSYRWTFSFGGERALETVSRLNKVYTAHHVIEI